MKRFHKAFIGFLLGAMLLLPGHVRADDTRYQYDENFPSGTFSLANWRAALRGLSQMDLMPLRPSAKRVLDSMEYGTDATAAAAYAGTGVTVTTDASVKQEGSASLKTVIDATNNRSFARTFGVNLSAYQKITVWTYASSTSSAIQFYLSDGTNSSYWDITTDGSATTWKQHTLTLASPDSNSGSVASLAAITSYGYRLLDNGVTYHFDTIKAINGMAVAVRGTNLGSYYKNVYLGISPLAIDATTSPTITAPSSNPRIDILTIDSAGTLAWITGAENSSPVVPWTSMPTNKIPICLVYNKTTETSILDYEDKDTDANQGYIYADVRPFLNLGGGSQQKGADVASATTVTLGNDGQVFDITGTTTITSITAKPAGSVIWLQFDGVVTVTDGSNLKLNGNFVTAAESVLQLFSDGTNWYEVSRQPTASTFLSLTDTPSSYSGQGLKGVRVNSGATALEFFTRNFIGLGDVPASFTGNAGKTPAVNSAENALEFVSASRITIYATGSGNFTAPTGVTKIYLTMVGPGGGGAGGRHGGGGAGGSSIINYPLTVIPGNNYPYVVGAGGPAGTNTGDGVAGGNTTFNTSIIAAGGAGGTSSGGVGGGGYSATNGSETGGGYTIAGGNGASRNTVNGKGGGGGGSPFATGGTGSAGTGGIGAGGAGGEYDIGGSVGGTGGDGGSGLIILMY